MLPPSCRWHPQIRHKQNIDSVSRVQPVIDLASSMDQQIMFIYRVFFVCGFLIWWKMPWTKPGHCSWWSLVALSLPVQESAQSLFAPLPPNRSILCEFSQIFLHRWSLKSSRSFSRFFLHVFRCPPLSFFILLFALICFSAVCAGVCSSSRDTCPYQDSTRTVVSFWWCLTNLSVSFYTR